MSTARIKVTEDIPNVEVHQLPCSVSTDEESNSKKFPHRACIPAKADIYWRPTPVKDNEHLSFFRGRQLNGEKVTLPSGCNGYVLDEPKGSLARKDDSRTMNVAGKFEAFTYWNWNMLPSVNDPVRRTMDWMDVSEALHGLTED